MLFIAHQNQNISQSFRKSCHSHRTPSRDKYKRSGSRKIYRRRGETESVKTRRSIDARVFIESFSPLPLPPSSWKMHEATTINSFRHFLDNRETFNRGPEEGKALVSRHCAPIVFHFDLSRLYTTAATWKNASLSNEQTLSPSREERWPSSNGHNASHGNLSPSSRAPLAFSPPAALPRNVG